MSDIEWRWADVDGTESTLRFEQLAEAISTQALPRFVLVWRTGWTDWFSADRVADLASAVGTVHSSPLTAVRITEGATRPPPPPVDRYQKLAPGHVGTLLRSKQRGPLSTVPPPPPPRPGRPFPKPPVPGIPPPPGFAAPPPPPPPKPVSPLTPTVPMAVAAPIAPPPPPPEPIGAMAPSPVFVSSAPIPIRDVQPTLADVEPVRSPTLRPMGAMPPPPRSIPQAKVPNIDGAFDAEVDVDTDETEEGDETERMPPPVEARPDAPPAMPPTPAPAAAAPFRKPVPPPELVTTQRSQEEPDPRGRARLPQSSLGGASRETVSRATMVAVLIPAALVFAAALLLKRPKSSPAPEPSATAATAPEPTASVARAPASQTVALPSASPAPAKAGCTLEHPATRLDDAAFVGVPLVVATAPGGEQAAVGFAAAKERAIGITVEPDSLAVTRAFEQTASGTTTLGVIPLTHGPALAFAVDRSDAKLQFSRTVDAEKRFTIGVLPDGFARQMGQKFSVIWPGKSNKPTITTPRVATVPGVGHAVTFRHGGQEGKVLVGWLTDAGDKLTNLKAVNTEATILGTPTVSASDSNVLVTFAAKLSPSDGFRAELALGPKGGLPEKSTPMVVPPGGPGGEAISPSSEALPGGRFVLQWTEGSAGNRAVRAQMLSATLEPMGEPITLSAPEQNAGQGALWVHGERALALFLVKKESSHELWGASLKCP
ncbi:MAG TPA: hypothetical protein VHE30_17540 [Polyangiaceae bacterium]|nr:hypothetical protein [Polyangiaceae bacterium]